MSNYLEQLAAFDRRTGKMPIDPTRIEGFGPGNVPPPPLAPGQEAPKLASASEMYGDPVERFIEDPDEVPEIPPSPLVALAQRPVVKLPVGGAELWISGSEGEYRGRRVDLSDRELAQVASIVLKAIRRSLDEQYQEITGRLPRKTRKAQPGAPAKPRGRRPKSPA